MPNLPKKSYPIILPSSPYLWYNGPQYDSILRSDLLALAQAAAKEGIRVQVDGMTLVPVTNVTNLTSREELECLAPLGAGVLGELRIGDIARDAVITHLHERFGGGYLSPAELDARVNAAMAAKIQRELTALTADLPTQEKKKEEPASTRQDKILAYLMCAGTLFMLMAGLSLGAITMAVTLVFIICGFISVTAAWLLIGTIAGKKGTS